ncbi:zinc ABC transporter substrate-binding protein [Candidatus Peregrinibacteria bacterium]|nr:zinc ABC transporter substrate-binding protein [Candidatus Peregrinibacteria bacterium]
MKRFLPILILVGLLSACTGTQTSKQAVPPAEKLKVSASFYPLAYLSERIAGDAAVVTQVIPSGVEPHDYEPTPQQLTAVYESKILVMNGQGLDPWAEKSREQITSKGISMIVATEGADLLSSVREEEEEHEGEEEHHVEGEFDPHVWLDPVQMRSVAVRIRDAFIAADPSHAETYRVNADALIADLNALDSRFRSNLKTCTQTKVIVSHDAFRYMARQYDFETLALAGVSPDEEPSPKKIAEIIDTAKREKLKVVFFETLVSPKLAESVANGAEAQTLVLNPIEGLTSEDLAQGKTYLTVMQDNADNLAIALECQK